MQHLIAIHLLHKESVDRQCSRCTLAVRHAGKVHVHVFSTYPASYDELRCESHEPSVGIGVRGSCLSSHISPDAVDTSDTSGRTFPDDTPEHRDHLVSRILAEHLVQPGGECVDDITVGVLNSLDEQRRSPQTVIRENRVSADHLTHADVARAEAESHIGFDRAGVYTALA